MTSAFVNFEGAQIALLLARPNWGSPVKLAPMLPADVQKALSGDESRRNFARTFRHSFEYSIDTDPRHPEEPTELRLWLLRVKPNDKVVVPLWTDGVELSADKDAGSTNLPFNFGPLVRGGYYWIIIDDDDNYEIVKLSAASSVAFTVPAGTTRDWPAGTTMFPLLFGAFAERPKFDAVTDEVISGAIKIEEDSPITRRIAATIISLPTVGAAIAEFATKPLWTLEPNRVRVLDTTEIEEISQSIGFLREKQKQVSQFWVARGYEMEFQCHTRDEILFVERMFTDRLATTRTFMMPTFNGDMRLAADLPQANLKNIPIEVSRYADVDYSNHPGMPYIAIVSDAGVRPRRATFVNSTTSIVQTAVNDATVLAKEGTIISHLPLVRFADPELKWNYEGSDTMATARIRFIEVPNEYAAPKPDLPEPGYLYSFYMNLPIGQISLGRYTNYETTIINQRADELWSVGADGGAGNQLVFQGDGNLVLYAPGVVPIWASNTGGSGATHVHFQPDGNLVLHNEDNVAVWSAGFSDGAFSSGVGVVFQPGDVLVASGGIVSVGQHSLMLVNGRVIIGRHRTFTPGPYEHGDIERTTELTDATELTSWGDFPGNPLAKFLPFSLEANLRLTIAEVNVAAPYDGTMENIFDGVVKAPRMVGNDWKATVDLGGIIDGKFPRKQVQRTDNYMPFTPPSQIDEVDFLEGATITALSGFNANVSGPAGVEDYYAGGMLFTGAGANQESRSILSSTPIAGGQSLTLDRPLLIAAIGAAATMFRGYNGSYAECVSKFDNGINFGGYPAMSTTGPQIKAAETAQAGGGKK